MTNAPKRGRGRPPLVDARSKVVGVRFTAGELAAIESAAHDEGSASGGMTAAEWVRTRALEALGS